MKIMLFHDFRRSHNFPSAVCGALALLVCSNRAEVFVANVIDMLMFMHVYFVCAVYQIKVIGTSRTGN